MLPTFKWCRGFKRISSNKNAFFQDPDELKDLYAHHQSTRSLSLKITCIYMCSFLAMIYYSWIWERLPEIALTESILNLFCCVLLYGKKRGEIDEYILKYKLETTVLISLYPGALYWTTTNILVKKLILLKITCVKHWILVILSRSISDF